MAKGEAEDERIVDEAVATAPSLRDVSVRELLAQLTIVRARLLGESQAGGYQTVPNQNYRRAQLRRQEQDLVRQLRIRQNQWRRAITTTQDQTRP